MSWTTWESATRNSNESNLSNGFLRNICVSFSSFFSLCWLKIILKFEHDQVSYRSHSVWVICKWKIFSLELTYLKVIFTYSSSDTRQTNGNWKCFENRWMPLPRSTHSCRYVYEPGRYINTKNQIVDFFLSKFCV